MQSCSGGRQAGVANAVRRTGNDLLLRHAGGTDTLSVRDHFSDVDFAVEQIEFADGTIWDATALDGMIQTAPALDGMTMSVNDQDNAYVLLENQVQRLINAMAVFQVQSAGDLNIPQNDIDTGYWSMVTWHRQMTNDHHQQF